MVNAWSKDFGIAKEQNTFHSAAGEIPANISSQNSPKPRKGTVRGFAISNSAVEVPDLFKTLVRKPSEKPVRRRAGEMKEGIRC